MTNILLIRADDVDGTTSMVENTGFEPLLAGARNSLTRRMTGTGDPLTSQFHSGIGQVTESIEAPTP